MSKRTRLPAIPDIPVNPDTSAIRRALLALREAIGVITGQSGQVVDRAVTFRDLQEAGLTDGSLASIGNITGGGGWGGGGGSGGSGGSGGETETIDDPSPPTGVEAWGAISTIFVQWDRPTYRGHAYTEVWAAPALVGNPDVGDFAARVLVGQATGAIFGDTVAPQTTRFYWVRHVNKATSPVFGPWSDVLGVKGESSLSPAYVLPILSGQIRESELYAALGARINLIDGPDSLAGSVAARILAEANARAAAITSEATTRQSADSSLASQVTTLTASVGSNAAAITSEATARSNADSALSSRIDVLAVGSGARIFRQATAPEAASAGDLWYDTSANNRPRTKNAGGGWDDCDDTRIAATQASVSTESSARASADSALSTSISNVSSTVNGHTTTLSTQATSIDGLRAQYVVKLDSNNYVSGFGLASTPVNGTPYSEFIVRADSFAIASPSGPGIAPSEPFIVRTTAQTINGVSVPPGVYMRDAFIQNGTVNDLKFDRASGNRIQILSADIVSLTADKIEAGTLGVGRYIQSQGYVPGGPGFRINANGFLDVGDIDCRGRVRTPGKWFGDNKPGAVLNCYSGDPFLELWINSGSYLRWHPTLGLEVRGNIEAISLKADAVSIVKTLHIAGNAITVPAAAYSSIAAGVFHNAWTRALELSVYYASSPQTVTITGTCNFIYSGGSGANEIRLRVTRDGVQIRDYVAQSVENGFGGALTIVVTDAPGAGSFAYAVEAYSTVGNIYNMRARSLLVTGSMR